MSRAILVCLMAVAVWSTSASALEAEREAQNARDNAHGVIIGAAAAGAVASSVIPFLPQAQPLMKDGFFAFQDATGGDGIAFALSMILVTPAVGAVAGSVLGVLGLGIATLDPEVIFLATPLALGLATAGAAAVIGATVGCIWLANEVKGNPVGDAAVGVFAISGGALLILSSPLLAAGAAGGGAVLAYDLVKPLDDVE